MLLVPLTNDFGTLWVAVELTTIVSVLLVAIDRTDAALEAAWKYVLIASVGLGIALLAVILLYAAGTGAARRLLPPALRRYLAVAGQPARVQVEFAFLLAVVGFGTKVGFAPLHTWLPDAHCEAPSPVSALLSGALLANAFYAILRFYQVTAAAGRRSLPAHVLLVFGAASLVARGAVRAPPGELQAAARLLVDRAHGRDRARHRLRRPARRRRRALPRDQPRRRPRGSPSSAAGSLLRRYDTKEVDEISGAATVAAVERADVPRRRARALRPAASPACSAASSRSSAAASPSPAYVGVALLLVFVNLAFFGVLWHAGRMVLTPAAERAPSRGETSWWMVAAMAACLFVVVGARLSPSLRPLGVAAPRRRAPWGRRDEPARLRPSRIRASCCSRSSPRRRGRPRRRTAAAGPARPPRGRRRHCCTRRPPQSRSSRRRARAVAARRGRLAGRLSRCAHRSTGARDYRALSRVTAARCCQSRSCTTGTAARPPGTSTIPRCAPDPDRFEHRVVGERRFVIPYGPVRSGVFESIQFLIETGGEDVLALQVAPVLQAPRARAALRRVRPRARGAGRRAGRRDRRRRPRDRVLPGGRARARCRADPAGAALAGRPRRARAHRQPPRRRAKHAEDAALSVGQARFGILKEQILRLRARLCGSRFGRGVVVPGGLAAAPRLDAGDASSPCSTRSSATGRDRRLLARHRLDDRPADRQRPPRPRHRRGLRRRRPGRARVRARHGRPLRASLRRLRPLGGPRSPPRRGRRHGAALLVRFGEIAESLHILRQAIEQLDKYGPSSAPPLPAAERRRVRLGRSAAGRAGRLGRSRRRTARTRCASARRRFATGRCSTDAFPQRRAHRLRLHRAQLRAHARGSRSLMLEWIARGLRSGIVTTPLPEARRSTRPPASAAGRGARGRGAGSRARRRLPDRRDHGRRRRPRPARPRPLHPLRRLRRRRAGPLRVRAPTTRPRPARAQRIWSRATSRTRSSRAARDARRAHARCAARSTSATSTPAPTAARSGRSRR